MNSKSDLELSPDSYHEKILNLQVPKNYQNPQNVEQATELIEAGFEYVTEMDGLKLFRKRK